MTALSIEPPRLFSHLSDNVHPVASPSRRYSKADQEFISDEISRLLKEGIIEPSNSPWRAQVLVVKSKKKRLVIDYSTTINKFTYLDSYPLPNLEDTVNEIAGYAIYSLVDMKSAYHQVPLSPEEKHYTGFEANGALYQFRRLCFGLTNAVAVFQRVMNNIIKNNNLKGVFAYLDDVICCGVDQADHDRNLRAFLDVVAKYRITLNKEKSVFNQKCIKALGFEIRHNEVRPDPERLGPIQNLEPPQSSKEHQRLLGLFAYYSKWIPRFSERLRPLVKTSIPFDSNALKALADLKKSIMSDVKARIDEWGNFKIETDASDYAISAILSQDDRPVAFYSRTLSASEAKHSAVDG